MGKYNISFPLGSINNTIEFSPNTIKNMATMEDISVVNRIRTQSEDKSIVIATSNAEGIFTYNGVQLNIFGYIGAKSPIEYNKDLALGNGYYYLDTEGHLIIEGSGELMYGTALPWIDNKYIETVKICTIKDTINASNLSYYFYNAINLNTISNIPISAVNIQSMFENCSNIQNIPVIPSEVLNITNAFKGCIDLSGYQNLLADPTDYSGCYENAAVNDTGLFVDFDSNIGSKIDLIIDTKSENSNIHRALKLTQDIELPNVTTDDAKGTQFELNINKNVVPTNYTWYKNEEVIEGVNSKILNVANPDYWIDNNSVYKCKAVDMFENELSTEGTLTIEPLGIENVVINNAAECYDLGEVTLNAEVVGGTSGYTYQWYKNDIEITGETQLSIVIKNLQYADSNKDNYSCKVTNIKNTVESNNCTINILPNPVVVADLEQLSLKTHTNGTLNVTRISGTLPFTYEWYKDDILIENENNNSLELTDVALSLNESEIKCKVTNPSGSVFTNVSTLNIYELLKSVTLDESRELNDYEVITLKPTITSVNGNENNTYVYQWYKNNVAIPDETEETYVITNMYYKDYNDTNFACRVSLADDSEDTILSNNCNITFIIEELVLNEITLDTLSVGDTMELECSYSQGNERYNYVWYENNIEIKSGIDESILTKQITSDMYKNTYHCVVEGVFTKISNTVTLDLDLFVSEIYSVLDDGEIYSNVVYIEPNKESKFTIKADGGIKPYSYSWNLSQTANGLSGPYLADLNSENCSILLNFEECKQFEESSYNYFICKVEDSIPHAQWSNIAIKYAFECQINDLSLDYTYEDVLHISPDVIGLNVDSQTTYNWYSIDSNNAETLIYTSQIDDFSIDYVTNPIEFGAQAEKYKCVITNDGNTCSDEFTILYGLSMGMSVENAGEQYDSNKVYDSSVVCSIIPVDETASEENMRYNIEIKGDGGTYGGVNYTIDNTSDSPVLTFEDTLPWYDIKDKIVSVKIGESVVAPNISGWFHDCINLKTIQGEIPSSVINMNATFANCTNLEIGKVKNTGELTMDYAFLNCSELTTIPVISNDMVSAKDAFVGCSKLNKVNI